MRLSLILATCASFSLSFSSQVPFHTNSSASTSFSRTFIDILGDDPNYVSLLKLLQAARLVPTLNKLHSSTLFAPDNDAVDKYRSVNSLWNYVLKDPSFVLTDNRHEQLRQELLYHISNSTVTLPKDSEPQQVLKTLHYPHSPLEPPTRDPPPFPPWTPLPGGTLGGEPQRLRIAARGEEVWVGVDSMGKGGVHIVNGTVESANGVLFGINRVLVPPPDLATILTQQSDTSYFNSVLTSDITYILNTTTELTVFLPTNNAWKALGEYERLYLESGYADDDLKMILNKHAVIDKRVHWSESFDPQATFTTVDGNTLDVNVTPEKTTVSGATLVQSDIYASNGVLHLVDSLLFPQEELKMTPEKYLLTLDCSKFVSWIHESNLTFLINNTESKYTILAPRDDVISFLNNDDLPKTGSDKMEKMLRYHFLPGHIDYKKLKPKMLLETALEEKGLDGRKQVLSSEVDDKVKEDDRWKTLKLGGATVTREPVMINNTFIYFISKPVTPPSDALETALPMLDHSSFIAAILSTSIGDVLKNQSQTTLLLPNNDAFKRLGLLVSQHLLAAANKADLEKVLLHHTLASVQYAESLDKGKKHSFATLEDSDLTISRKDNGSIFISASGGWAGMRSELYPRDILTQTGVIHELSDILIPRSVDLTVGKLVKAAQGNTMANLLTKAGFDWVLNGTAPPEDSPWADLDNAGWTLLCPTDKAFDGLNVTELTADRTQLIMMVNQHLIPTPKKNDGKKGKMTLDSEDPLNNNRPLLLDEAVTYSTLRSPQSDYGDIVFRGDHESPGGYIVGIKNARGTDGKSDWAKVESWGRSTSGRGTGGVIQIDRLLMPYQPPWWLEYGAPSVVGVFGIAFIGAFFYGVRLIWRRDTTEATYEPIGGFARDDDEEA